MCAIMPSLTWVLAIYTQTPMLILRALHMWRHLPVPLYSLFCKWNILKTMFLITLIGTSFTMWEMTVSNFVETFVCVFRWLRSFGKNENVTRKYFRAHDICLLSLKSTSSVLCFWYEFEQEKSRFLFYLFCQVDLTDSKRIPISGVTW